MYQVEVRPKDKTTVKETCIFQRRSDRFQNTLHRTRRIRRIWVWLSLLQELPTAPAEAYSIVVEEIDTFSCQSLVVILCENGIWKGASRRRNDLTAIASHLFRHAVNQDCVGILRGKPFVHIKTFECRLTECVVLVLTCRLEISTVQFALAAKFGTKPPCMTMDGFQRDRHVSIWRPNTEFSVLKFDWWRTQLNTTLTLRNATHHQRQCYN